MTTRRKLITTALCLLTLSSSVVGDAVAAPRVSGIGRAPTVSKIPSSAFKLVMNGKIEVDPGCASEFPHWTRKLEFYDRPSPLCVRWIDKTPTEWARWELFKDNGTSEGQSIASGLLSEGSVANTSSSWKIQLAQYLPEHNTGSTAQKYYVRLTAKKKASDEFVQAASKATLVHLPKAGEPQVPPGNPYACSSSADKARKVTLSIPTMNVIGTSSTTGDGDRDELYFVVHTEGPTNSDLKTVRLPGYDDYYEAKKYQTVGPNQWTNQDEEHVAKPTIFNRTMKHGEKITLSLTAMEQDNSDLDNIKSGLIDAMKAVMAVALASNNEYGAIVAAVAATVAGTTGAFMPNTANHDYIGFVGLQLENKCGYVKMAWVTFSEKQIPGVGTVTNEFTDSGAQLPFESRLAVLSVENQFWPNGVDYGEYAHVGANDSIVWRAAGTSNAQYAFELTAKVSK